MGKPRGDIKEMDTVKEAIKLVDIILDGDYKEYKLIEKVNEATDGILDEIENKLDNTPNQDLAELTDEVFEELSGDEEEEPAPVKETMVNTIRQLIKEEDFRTFFKGMMKKYNITSPADLSDEKKKEFFAAVDRGWKAKQETD